MTVATPQAWTPNLQHERYGTPETYVRAAAWLKDCATVDDWGGSRGYLQTQLDASVRYRVIDGTAQGPQQVVADLCRFREAADGILLRHVLDHNIAWRVILSNAIAACRRRLVVVTFTPDAETTGIVKLKSGWPIVHFNPHDLRAAMRPYLVHDEAVQTSHPERIYYLEKGRC